MRSVQRGCFEMHAPRHAYTFAAPRKQRVIVSVIQTSRNFGSCVTVRTIVPLTSTPFPQRCSNPPWLATSPIKWKPVNSSSGSTAFRLEAARSNLRFALFKNGTTYPVLLLSTAELTLLDQSRPRYLRLARTHDASQMRVSFESAQLDGAARVRWGFEPGASAHVQTAVATPSTYTIDELCGPPATTHGWMPPPWFYTALMAALPAGATVYYSVGSDAMGWSDEASFVATVAASASATLRFVAIADVGETYIDGAQYHWARPRAFDAPWQQLRRACAALRRCAGRSSLRCVALRCERVLVLTRLACRWSHMHSTRRGGRCTQAVGKPSVGSSADRVAQYFPRSSAGTPKPPRLATRRRRSCCCTWATLRTPPGTQAVTRQPGPA